MKKKMKIYVLTLSKVFPTTHPRKGEPTDFKKKFLAAINRDRNEWQKKHTIRANYELWHKRFEQIDKGEACLSVRQWTGKPYCSKQIELARLTREDGIGLQKLKFTERLTPFVSLGLDGIGLVSKYGLALNDGLTFEDWREWFKSYDLSKPLSVIHFTKFRY